MFHRTPRDSRPLQDDITAPQWTISSAERHIEPLGHGVPWGTLRIVNDPHNTEPYVLVNKAIAIGRGKENDVILHDERISRLHAVLLFENGAAFALDPGATNGIIINGKPLRGKGQLQHSASIEIVDTHFLFLYSDESGLANKLTQETDEFFKESSSNIPLPSNISARFTTVHGPEAGRSWPISPPTTTIGRQSDNIICIPSSSVSRHHAIIAVQPAGLFIINLSSSGVQVNGEFITAPQRIQGGDHIQIGDCVYIIEGSVPSPTVDTLPTQNIQAINKQTEYLSNNPDSTFHQFKPRKP